MASGDGNRPSNAGARPPKKFGWRYFVLAALVVAATGGGTWFYFKHQRAEVRAAAGQTLASIADLKAGQIAGWMKERRNDAELVRFSVAVQQFLADPSNPDKHAAVRRVLGIFQQVNDYAAVAIFDAHGTLLLTVPDDGLSPYTQTGDEVQTALLAREVVLADLHRDRPEEPVHLTLLCPIGVNSQTNRPADAAMLLLVDPRRFLYPLVQSWPVPSPTAETLLVRREGNDVVFLNELRHRTNTALALRLPADARSQLPAATAVQGIEGVFEGLDYRGIPVLAATRRIPDTPWFMVAKFDQDEIYAPLRKDAWAAAAVIALILVAASLGLGLLWRQQKLALTREELAARKREEEARRESERKYRELVENANSIIVRWTREGRVAFLNEFGQRFFGYPEAEILGRHVIGTIVPETETGGRDLHVLMEKVTADPKAFEQNINENMRRNGERVWIAWTNKVVLDERGQVKEILSIGSDITARRQAEEQLRASEEQLRAYLDHAGDAIYVLESESGRIRNCNAHACNSLGYRREELLKLSAADIEANFSPAEIAETHKRLATAKVLTVEGVHRRKDSSKFPVEIRLSTLQGTSPACVISIVRDITARKQADEERARLSAGIEQAAESIVITDLGGNIQYVNPAFEQISGYSRQEVIGQNARILKSGHHDAAFYEQLWSTISQGRVWRGHFISKRKDGRLLEEEASISPVRDAEGTIINYMAVKLDVTHEKELERQFRQAQKLEAVGQLAGGVAHDFNNILAAILMHLGLLQQNLRMDAETRESLNEVSEGAKRAAKLTQQLLMFSRRSVLETRLLNLNDVVTNLLKMLGRLIGENINLRFERAEGLPLVEADTGMVEQVVMNLCVNARDAMPKGGDLTIALAPVRVGPEQIPVSTQTRPGRFVCLSVTDTGHGMDAETLKRVFEPFFTTKEAGKGTGLGLATVYGIAAQHRGWVTVDSEVGKGTVFRVFFPASTKRAAAADDAERPEIVGGHETILLVEDEVNLRRPVAQNLRRLGYRVLEAGTGQEAVDAWQEEEQQVDLLLSDMVMPGSMSGQDLAEKLRETKPGLKVIICSGYSTEIAEKGAPGKGILLMHKPYQIGTLTKAIRDCLDKK